MSDRNIAAAQAQSVVADFRERFERAPVKLRKPQGTGADFSLNVPQDLPNRLIYCLVDFRAKDPVSATTQSYWAIRGEVTASVKGVEIARWPFRWGQFTSSPASFIDYGTTPFLHGDEPRDDAILINAKWTAQADYYLPFAMPRYVYPLRVRLLCDTVRLRLIDAYPSDGTAFGQQINELRSYLACRSEI